MDFKGDRWKLVRSAYSPIFTSGKLKGMTSVMNRVLKSATNVTKIAIYLLYKNRRELR